MEFVLSIYQIKYPKGAKMLGLFNISKVLYFISAYYPSTSTDRMKGVVKGTYVLGNHQIIPKDILLDLRKNFLEWSRILYMGRLYIPEKRNGQ